MSSRWSIWQETAGSATRLTPSAVQALSGLAAFVSAASVLLAWAAAPHTKRLKRRRSAAGSLADLREGIASGLKTEALLLGALSLSLLAPLLLLRAPPAENHAAPTRPRSGEARVVRPSEQARARAVHSFHFRTFSIVLAASVALLGPLAFHRRRRLAAGLADGSPEAAAATREIVDSVAEIEADPDPRRAVIRAYERMERSLEAVDLERARDETASEFIRRSLTHLNVSGSSATRLTTIFEQARYSRHVIGSDLKRSAVQALRDVASEIGAA